MKKKLKINDHITVNGQRYIVWGINPNGKSVVLFSLESRNYVTKTLEELD